MAEPAGPNNVISALAFLRFRALLSPPYDDVSFGWTHSLAERRFPYIDGAGHDWTGRDPIRTTANMFFMNSLQPDAFPDLWDLWRLILIEGTIGTLSHPVLGEFQARVTKVDGIFVAKNRAGIIVRVSWVESLKDPNEAQVFKSLTVSLKKAAEAADTANKATEIDYPDGLRTDSLADLARQIEGALFSAELSLGGFVTQAKGIVGGMIDSAKAIDSFASYVSQDLMIQFYNGLIDIAEQAGADFARPTGKTTFPFETTLDVAAIELGNTTTELLGLNLNLVSKPNIPAGTEIVFYTE